MAKPQGKKKHLSLKAKLNDRCFRYFTTAILMFRIVLLIDRFIVFRFKHEPLARATGQPCLTYDNKLNWLTASWRLHKKMLHNFEQIFVLIAQGWKIVQDKLLARLLIRNRSFIISEILDFIYCMVVFSSWYDRGKYQLDIFNFTAPVNFMALLIIIVHFIYRLYFSVQKVILILVPMTRSLKIPLSKLIPFERKW